MARRKRLTLPIIWGAVVLVGASALGINIYYSRTKTLAETTAATKAWTLKGEACAALTAEEAESQGVKAKANKAFIFNDMQFARRFGHANCSLVGTGEKGGLGYFAVCQFSAPQVLVVTAGGTTTYFAPGTGRPATISMQGGVPRCVLATSVKP